MQGKGWMDGQREDRADARPAEHLIYLQTKNLVYLQKTMLL